jgi:hypothetical protein
MGDDAQGALFMLALVLGVAFAAYVGTAPAPVRTQPVASQGRCAGPPDPGWPCPRNPGSGVP